MSLGGSLPRRGPAPPPSASLIREKAAGVPSSLLPILAGFGVEDWLARKVEKSLAIQDSANPLAFRLESSPI